MKKLRQTDDNDDQSEPEQRFQSNNYTQGKGARVNDATFLTQSQNVVNQSFNKQQSKKGRAGGASNKQNSYATGKIVTIEDEQAD